MILDFLINNLATGVVFSVLFILTWFLMRTKRPPGIPPGPTPLPILGNFLQLGGDVRKVFKTLRGQYGDVFSVFMGDHLAIVVNGYDALKEAFIKNGDAFSNRSTRLFNFLPEHLRKSQGIVNSNGDVWRKNRRFALSTLRDFGMGKNKLQTSIQEEATELIQAIERLNGKAFNMSRLIHKAVSNIICSIVFGKRFEYDDDQFQQYVDTVSQIASDGGVQSRTLRFPFLKKLPGDITRGKRFTRNFSKVAEFISTSILQHLEVYDEHNINSVIDAYIKQEGLNKMQIRLEDIYGLELFRLILDLFLAGTETTATVLRWALLYYLNYPAIQHKAMTQVSNAVDPRRSPGMEDRIHMPYLEAMILEVLRHANIAPLSVPHEVSDDTKLRGYHIPKGSMAIVNIDSVMTDPRLWKNPDQFDPDRFLERESLTKIECFIPFSLGKRMCLGESLARMELTIFLAALTRHFEFLPPEGENPPPIEGKLGVAFSPNQYMIRAVKRNVK